MFTFDPASECKRLQESVGRFDFRPVPIEYSSVTALCSNSVSLLRAYVKVVLGAGSPALATEALTLAHARASAAVALYRDHLSIAESGPIDERSGIAMFQMAKAIDVLLLHAWLRGEAPPSGLASEYGRLITAAMLRSTADDVTDNGSIALVIVPLMGHGLWEAVRPLVEVHPKFGTDKFKPQRPTRVAYALATDPAERRDPGSPALRKAAGHLRAQAHDLASAHVSPLLHWLRVLEWREGSSGLTPRQVLLRAYAYMPDVVPPVEIRAEVEALKSLSH